MRRSVEAAVAEGRTHAEVQLGGQVIRVPLGKAKRRKHGPRSRAGKAHDRKVERAKRKAMAELRDRHPEEYAEILAEVRHRMGLPDWTPQRLLVQMLASKTISPVEVYHAEPEEAHGPTQPSPSPDRRP